MAGKALTLGEVLSGLGEASRGVRFLQGEARETFVSYPDLLARARGLLAVFQRRGLRAGDPLLLFLRNNVALVDVFWACQLGGLVPVPLSVAVCWRAAARMMRRGRPVRRRRPLPRRPSTGRW